MQFTNLCVVLQVCILVIVHKSYQACDVKTGLTECQNTPIRKGNLQSINPQTVTLSLKNPPSDTTLAADTFNDLPKIENLYLSFSKIKTLEPGCFRGLTNLRFLSLANNELEIIPNGIFNTCRELKTLYLNLNKIKTIANNAFNEVVGLDDLDLSSNALENVPNMQNLVSLTKLNLGYNMIRTIASGQFSTLRQLQSLKLNDNKVTSIHQNAFQGLTNLQELDVRSNYLTSLDVANLNQESRRLRSINISINDFTCDTLRSILRSLEQSNIAVVRGVSKSSNAINGISCK